MDNFYKIDAYLKGELSAKEKAVFEKTIATDADLKAAVQQHRLEFEMMNLMLEDELRTDMDAWMEEGEEASAPKAKIVPLQANKTRRFLSIAATVLFLVSIVFVLQWYNKYRPSNGASALAHYESPDFSTLRNSSTDESFLKLGELAMDKQDYDAALQFFQQIKVGDTAYPLAQYQMAHLYFQQKKYALAVDYFQNTIAVGEGRLRDGAEWYLMLAYWQNDEQGQANKILKERILSNRNHRYYYQAEKVNISID